MSAQEPLPATDATGETQTSSAEAQGTQESAAGEAQAAAQAPAPDDDEAVAEVAPGHASPAGDEDVVEDVVDGEDPADDGTDADDAEDEEDDAEEDPEEDSRSGASTAAGGAARGKRPLSRERTEQLEREGEIAADFLERLLDIADMDGDIDVDIDGDRAAVAIVDSEEGRVPRRLVGQDGKVLEALQELARLAVQAETGDRSRLMLDVAGHRAGRRRLVTGEAREAIAEIRAGAERVEMKPMTAFERKVVHDEILAAGLVSESDGVEPARFVVVYPA